MLTIVCLDKRDHASKGRRKKGGRGRTPVGRYDMIIIVDVRHVGQRAINWVCLLVPSNI